MLLLTIVAAVISTSPVGNLLRHVSEKTSGGFVVRRIGSSASFFRLSRGNDQIIVQKGGSIDVTAKLG